jgi:hypothetical protein
VADSAAPLEEFRQMGLLLLATEFEGTITATGFAILG